MNNSAELLTGRKDSVSAPSEPTEAVDSSTLQSGVCSDWRWRVEEGRRKRRWRWMCKEKMWSETPSVGLRRSQVLYLSDLRPGGPICGPAEGVTGLSDRLD